MPVGPTTTLRLNEAKVALINAMDAVDELAARDEEMELANEYLAAAHQEFQAIIEEALS